MGSFYFGNNEYKIDIDDRALAHFKIALLSVLRKGASVAFSFSRAVSHGGGRETLWITPTSQIRFRFTGSRPPAINEQWVREIIQSSLTPRGMYLMSEMPDTGELLETEVPVVPHH